MTLPLGSKAAVLHWASELPPRCLQEPPAMQTNMDYINRVNPNLSFMKTTKQTGLGRRVNFLPTTLQLVSIKMIWRVCLYLVKERNPGTDGCLWE